MDHLQEILADNQVLSVVLLVAVVPEILVVQTDQVVLVVQLAEQITAEAQAVPEEQITIIQEVLAAEVPEDILVMVAEEVQTIHQITVA